MNKNRVLLVEDNDGDAVLVREYLGEEWEIDRAKTLSEAISLLRAAEYSAVISDLNLPDSSGIETFLAISEATSAAIIVLTGSDGMEERAMMDGAQDYISKNTLDRHLSRSMFHAVERQNRTNFSAVISRIKENMSNAIRVLDNFAGKQST